jgi:S1-C subfamily serine protease
MDPSGLCGHPETADSGYVLIGIDHLSGPRQGSSETARGPVVRIGSDERLEVALEEAPGVENQHALIIIDGDEARLQTLAPVRVNEDMVDETRLRDGDVLELGQDTRLCVHLIAEEAALPPGGEAGGLRLTPPPSRRSSAFSMLTPWVLLACAGVVSWVALSDRADRQEVSFALKLEEEQLQQSAELWRTKAGLDSRLTALRAEIVELESRAAQKHEIEESNQRIKGEVQAAFANLERSLLERVPTEISRRLDEEPALNAAREAVRRIESMEGAVERIIARNSDSVCFIQGAYGFGRKDGRTGKWLYLRQVSDELLKDIGPTGDKVPLTLDGDGKVFEVEYTGTGFLAGSEGLVLTNRHIAEPWWKNEAAEPLITDGFTPRFRYLRAFFPGNEEPVTFDLAKTILSDKADIAVLNFVPSDATPEPLPLDEKNGLAIGRRVILIGYPSGMNALLAKSEEDFARQLVNEEELNSVGILDALAKKGAVRPLPSHGHVSDILPDKILYDAPTAVGGSGGPVFDLDGRVVAVNYGILKAFQGANFGVPIALGRDLIERARKEPR